MALKALIFTMNHQAYQDFITRHRLDPMECKHADSNVDIHGYRKETNPDLRPIFLKGFWLRPIGQHFELANLAGEFKERSYFQDRADAAAMLLKLDHITDPSMLPEYLSHEDPEVREEARAKLEDQSDRPLRQMQ